MLADSYANGYWKEIGSFIRSFFLSTFKTNWYLESAVITGLAGVACVSDRLTVSIFSDLNMSTATMMSDKYAAYFGFTEEEVFAAMDQSGMTNKEEMKAWYGGFTVDDHQVYNPWSFANFLKEREFKLYWENQNTDGLVSTLIREGDRYSKMQFELLLSDKTIWSRIDDEVVLNEMEGGGIYFWSFLLALGYLKIAGVNEKEYELALTNQEVKKICYDMVKSWFRQVEVIYNKFIKALLQGNLEEMNGYMNEITDSMSSMFDTGGKLSRWTPERFYHGFVLGLLVELAGRYKVTSNRESGFGRYDVMLEPLNREDDGIILEFKVHDPEEESTLEETVQAALQQIEEKKYEQTLLDSGIGRGRIWKYGFAFEGKKVLIG